jgi:polar amino acid transport system substrate-binding protein
MKRIWAFFTVVLVVILSLSACAPKEEAASALDAVMEKGKLICATSADFPPMEFVNEDGTFSGFDIDFITELGTRMGVEVEVWDMPFDSVIQALADGKVDCAIAAMGPTAERDEKVDFSISYKLKTYVLMANKDNPITINTINDVANYKLGTLSGGLQVVYFEDNWIKPGLMKPENLVQYDRTDSGILDLAAGRLDLWWTQDVVAQVWSEKENVYTAFIVPQEILGGDTVIMLPEGDAAMKAKFDEIISGMLSDGFRDQLLDTWGIPRQ